MQGVRSALFMLGWAANTVLVAFLCMIGLLLPYRVRYAFVTYWCWFALKWLELTCGLKGRILGLENLPKTATVVMSKHQSTWEPICLQWLLPITAWVVKRELLWIPFFGWGLWSLRPIAIDRGKRGDANHRVVAQGSRRLQDGAWIVIFPEGTRIAAGRRGQYKQGGARLACALGAPVVPVAVNAGEFWPRGSFVIHPGVTTLSIGPPIATAGKTAAEVSREVESWIETEMTRISGVGPCWPANKRPEQVHGPRQPA